MRFSTHILTLIGLMSACLGSTVSCSTAPNENPIVTVSIEPQKYLLEQITGDRVEVRTLIANGANPETYDPSVTHILNLNKSIGFLRMGNIGFEDALLDKIRQEAPELPIFNTSLGITPVTGTHNHGGVAHSTVDPHTWTSVKNAKIIIKNMLVAMLEIDPSNSSYYKRNYDKFALRLDSLDNAISSKLARHSGEAFRVWHPSLSYFARDYGLEQIPAGNSDNKDISMTALKEVIDHAGNHGAKLFFYQKDFDSRQAESLSSQLGLVRISINPLSYDWEKELSIITDAIVNYSPENKSSDDE